MAYLLNKIKVASSLFLFDVRIPLRKKSFELLNEIRTFLRFYS